MSEKLPNFKALDSCAPGELIRIRLGKDTEWALTGRRSGEFFPVFVLPKEGAPYFLNVFGPMDILKSGYENPVLSYGHHYELRPDHKGPCDVTSGPLFEVEGALILSGTDYSIQGEFRNEKRAPMHYDFSGVATGKPGGSKAVFGQWSLRLLPSITGEEEPIPVISFAAKPAKRKSEAA
jgi:hypothetical protein